MGPGEGDRQRPKARGHVRRSSKAFYDDLAVVIEDPDHSHDEARFVLLGFSAEARILVVVHAHRSHPETIRIISARKATKAERVVYVKRHHP